MKSIYSFISFCLLCLMLPTLKAQDKNIEVQLAGLIEQVHEYYDVDAEKALSFAKQAEAITNKSNNLAHQALVYTLLGNIYGLKQNRSDKAADYHQQAFLVYNDLYSQNQITSQFFYGFFTKNIAPIYELISSEDYHRRRRDRKAIRKYQELYTKLSRFFLEKKLQQPELKTIKSDFSKNIVLTNFSAKHVVEEHSPKKASYEALNHKLMELYLSYISELEQSIGEKGIDIEDIKLKILKKKQQIQSEVDSLQLTIIAKDSIRRRDILLAKQQMQITLANQRAKDAELRLEKAANYQTLSTLGLVTSVLVLISGFVLMRYHQNKQEKKIVEYQNLALTQSNEELEQFAHKVSHDLRSPLASVMGLLYIAQQEQDIIQMKVYFAMIEQNLTKLDTFIDDMLAHSKNARTEVLIEEIDLEVFLEEVIAQHQYSNQDAQLNVKLDIQGEEKLVFTDRYRLSLILNNLISNAYRYADKEKMSSFLEISAQIDQQKLQLNLKDNGVGIAKGHQAKIFDMFYRANAQTKGTGLGLYIVQQGVDKLGGKITLNSEEGIGTKFEISIPNRASNS